MERSRAITGGIHGILKLFLSKKHQFARKIHAGANMSKGIYR